MYEFYKIDTDGRTKEYFQSEENGIASRYVVLADNIADFNYPRWDFDKKEWYEGGMSKDILGMEKEDKIKHLHTACGNDIVSNFEAMIKGITYHFSYSVEKQQNFSDTMRLFENNMIDSIGWNAYLGDDKVRIQLDKKDFTQVYLSGVKHKTNCLSTLNDILLPMVNDAKDENQLSIIYWNRDLTLQNFTVDESNTMEKKTDRLEIESKRNMNGILELTTVMLMGGMG